MTDFLAFALIGAPAQLWRIKDGECLCPYKTLKLQRKTYNN